MVKVRLVIIVLALLSSCLYGYVVINEIMYDSPSVDTGNEWIELYNNGDADVNLEGARIQVAGTEFTDVFIFPYYVLRAGRFVLIGEANITQAQFIAQLVMQNGGDATDGVRFVSSENLYTDTVLYDFPNPNNLLGDNGINDLVAEDVEPGHSLARHINGQDTNDCMMDFTDEPNPTPGMPNPEILDYALQWVDIYLYEDYSTFVFEVQNNSWVYNDSMDIRLDLSLNGQILRSFQIEPVPYQFNQGYSENLFDIDMYTVGLLEAELVLENDANLEDNYWSRQLGSGHYDINPVINEIMYDPATGEQEWVELRIPGWGGWLSQFTLHDASGNEVDFTLPSLCPEYVVLCEDLNLMLSSFPDCLATSVIEVVSLPSLNNTGDTLVLTDNLGAVMDSVTYTGVTNKQGKSLERQVFPDSTISWHYCLDTDGATPGLENSEVPPPPDLEAGHIRLQGSPFNPSAGESMTLEYSFVDEENTISCYVYDLSGNKRHIIASGMAIGSSGSLSWDGKTNSGKALPRGIYVLLTEARNSDKNIILRKQLTVVLATK